MPNAVDSSYGVLVWRSIRNGSRMKENLSFKVGDGNKIIFLEGQVDWVGVFKVNLPRFLFILCQP